MKNAAIVSIPLLCCAVTFLVIGNTMGNITFLCLGAAFAATGVPLLVIAGVRQRTTTA